METIYGHGRISDMENRKKVILVIGAFAAASDKVIGLVRAGYAVECAASSRDALERLGRSADMYNAVVVTTEVDHREQQEVACAVRNMRSGARLPIVCLGTGIERATGSVYTLVPDTLGDLHRALDEAFAARVMTGFLPE